MNFSRFLLLGLAVLLGAFGGLCVFGSLAIIGKVAYVLAAGGAAGESKGMITGYTVLVVFLGATGIFPTRIAWRHLSQPSLRSARTVAGTFCFVAGFLLFALASRNLAPEKMGSAWNQTLYLGFGALMMGAAWLLYHFVLKRVSASAFPASESHA